KLPIGDGLESCTADITLASVEHRGRIITFIDTPGFDDSEKTPAEHLALLMARLDEMHRFFKGRPHIHGAFYVHRITDNKITKSAKMNIRVFQKLLGDHALKNLVFVTNMWDGIHKDKYARFERELMGKAEYFGAAIGKGARAGAAYRIHEDATSSQVQEALLDVFLENNPEVLQIQREMVAKDVVEISSTEAGMVIREELREAKHNLRARLGELERRLKEVPEAEEQEQADILADIEDLTKNLNEVEVQDLILNANTEFLREVIPSIGYTLAMAASAVATTTAETSAALTVAFMASGGTAAVGLGIIALYVWWKTPKRK
ncbi:hypothetical protein FRC11_011216, partial [Ceratobasidium sp. 423]